MEIKDRKLWAHVLTPHGVHGVIVSLYDSLEENALVYTLENDLEFFSSDDLEFIDDGEVHTRKNPMTFVFGSNRLGIHGAGAAVYAKNHLMAQNGVGEGQTGNSYALPTCSKPGVPLKIEEVFGHVAKFIEWARRDGGQFFFVSEVGCGLAGFTVDQIAPMFVGAPLNCKLPTSFLRSYGITDARCDWSEKNETEAMPIARLFSKKLKSYALDCWEADEAADEERIVNLLVGRGWKG